MTEEFDRTLPGLFREWARRDPARPALVWTGGTLTYGELDELSDRVAGGLAAAGVEPGDTVGVLGERGAHTVAALVGVTKAGAAAAYLDPRIPDERLGRMLRSAGAGVVLAADGTRLGADVTSLPLIPDGPTPPPAGTVPPESVATIYFTSGSTGTPKPVAATHRNVVCRLVGQHFSFRPDDVVLQHAPLSWDAGTLELWGSLVSGARCVLPSFREFELDGLREHVTAFGVSVLWLTATLLNLVVDECPELLATPRLVLTGGEPASARHIREARARYPALRLVNGYGPVETTIFATTHEITETAPELGSGVPIGRPLTDTEIHLLDPERRPVPVGEVGEIWIGGAGVTTGYVDDPAATEARFVTLSPAGAEPVRLYRSGDLGRLRPDGVLEFAGRVDDEVKIRGHRIDLGEVTSVLAGADGVRQAFVDVVGDGDTRRLVAYVVLDDPGAGLDAVRAAASAALPPHLVPSDVVGLAEIPLTDSGKLARDRLPRPGGEQAPIASELESVVHRIWLSVLGATELGVTDSFLVHGGNSLTAARIVQRMRKEVSPAVTLKLVFANPTVRSLATAVRELPPVTGSAVR